MRKKRTTFQKCQNFYIDKNSDLYKFLDDVELV